MSFLGGPRVPATPTLPQGETVASYGTYLEAQRAVDHLSDKQFPVQVVTIVGTELRMVERVTGRLSYPRVAIGGFGSGAWFGVFIGLLFLMAGGSAGILFAAVLFGGAAGLLLAVITYALTGGKRDFTSQSQIVATRYAVLCATEKAHEARSLLREVGGVQAGGAAGPAAPAAAGRPSDPSAAYPVPTGAPQPGPGQPGGPQPGTPPVQPRYGRLAPQPGEAPTAPQAPAPEPTAQQPSAPQPPAEPRYGQMRPDPQQPGERQD